MTDIVAFLNARLDEDEHTAKSAAQPQILILDAVPAGPSRYWKATGYDAAIQAELGQFATPPTDEFEVSDESGVILAHVLPWEPTAQHVARHDPARVLREVAAKRRVLERHCRDDEPYRPRLPSEPYTWPCIGCGSEVDYGWNVADINDCPELRDMASVYSEHPDYDPAWRVDS